MKERPVTDLKIQFDGENDPSTLLDVANETIQPLLEEQGIDVDEDRTYATRVSIGITIEGHVDPESLWQSIQYELRHKLRSDGLSLKTNVMRAHRLYQVNIDARKMK